jgi:carboxyl-terminal processing protease
MKSSFRLVLPSSVMRTSLPAKISLFIATLLLPVATFALPAAQSLTVPDDQNVTRGDFIRGAITALDIEPSWHGTLPYKRTVSKQLMPYVGTAYQMQALKVFGSDLALSKPITRGEAVQLLVALRKLSPKGSASFTDAPKGSDLEKAARIAVEQKWVQPLRKTLFGSDHVLSGRDARILLARAVGEQLKQDPSGGLQEAPITIEMGGKKSTNIQLPNQDLMNSIWGLLNSQYLYKEKLNGNDASYKAAQALVESLKDPYTTFMPPAPAAEFRTQLEGEVTGIGAQVEYKSNILTIVAPLPGSPALTAGLKPADQILKVDGESLAGLSFIEAVAKVRGPKGSTAKLTIKRDGQEMEIPVTRDTIKVPEIDVSWQGSIAIVRIVQFGQRTQNELRSIVSDIQLKHPTGVIIDLRNDPGGYLDAATIALSNFLPKGSSVAHIVSRTEELIEKTDDEPTLDASVRMAVLVNKGSASASEIFAGALQDAKRATIVGEQSFGKGTVQQVLEFRDGSGLKMTIAEWFTPLRRKIDGLGVTPDVVIPAVDGRDEQLLKALDILR